MTKDVVAYAGIVTLSFPLLSVLFCIIAGEVLIRVYHLLRDIFDPQSFRNRCPEKEIATSLPASVRTLLSRKVIADHNYEVHSTLHSASIFNSERIDRVRNLRFNGVRPCSSYCSWPCHQAGLSRSDPLQTGTDWKRVSPFFHFQVSHHGPTFNR
jgi:hypothetical protein